MCSDSAGVSACRGLEWLCVSGPGGEHEALHWLLVVVAGDDEATITGWHLIWRQPAGAVELVAAHSISPLRARAWQASSEPR